MAGAAHRTQVILRSMGDLDEAARQLAADHSGVITARQAAALGLSARAVAGRVERGHWPRIHTGVYARRQVQVRRGGRSEYRDLIYDAYGIVVETDGRAAHLVTAAWQDAHRDNSAAADGFITLRYSWSDVNGRPCYVARQVAAALTQRGWPGKLRHCSPACTGPRPGSSPHDPH
jgi:very-short-patch-repair endonuclease